MKNLNQILKDMVKATNGLDGQRKIGNNLIMWRIIPKKNRCPKCKRKL